MALSWELVEETTPDEWHNSTETPWERMPGETDLQFARFVQYRDLGPGRMLATVAKEEGVTAGVLSIQASAGHWAHRAARWDWYLDQVYQHEVAEHTKQMARRHAAMSEKALTALALPIEVLLAKNPEEIRAELDAQDLMKLYNLIGQTVKNMPPMMNTERLAYGAPTDITRRQDEHTIQIDPEDQERLADILKAVIGTNILDDLRGEGITGEIVDAEVYEIHSSDTPPETDSLPARTAD